MSATVDEVAELVGLFAAYYQADAAVHRGIRATRRDAQTIVCGEVLRLLAGDRRALEELRGYGLVPLDLDDLPLRYGGTAPNDDPDDPYRGVSQWPRTGPPDA